MAKVDIDANPVTPGMFAVMSIPTLILFKGGQPVDRIVGYQPKGGLKAKIDAHLAPSA
jgi:thioredoxin 1